MSCYCRQPNCPKCNPRELKSPVPAPHNRCDCDACLSGFGSTAQAVAARENGPKYREWKTVVLDFDEDKMAQAGRLMLEAMGEDPDRDGLKDTPRRFARYQSQIMNGNFLDPTDYVTQFENDGGYDGAVVVKDLPFYTLCEHHLAPFIGTWDVAYKPSHRIIGLSKLVRIARVYQKRPQVQERLTKQIADKLFEILQPEWVVIRMQAEHFCMSTRGVRTPGALTETLTGRGSYPKDIFTV